MQRAGVQVEQQDRNTEAQKDQHHTHTETNKGFRVRVNNVGITHCQMTQTHIEQDSRTQER